MALSSSPLALAAAAFALTLARLASAAEPEAATEAPVNPLARAEQLPPPGLAEDLASKEEVAFVFASPEPTRAPSLMGHAFLHFGGTDPTTRELARDGVSFEYAAENDDTSLTTVRKGLFGGYTGILHDYPSAVIADRYRVRQRRDLWVYRLKLTTEERARLVAAVLREKRGSFAYAFATNNCATLLQRLVAEAFEGERRTRLADEVVVSPASLASALVDLGAVDGSPVQLRAESNAAEAARFPSDASAPAPEPHRNHGPLRFDMNLGYFGYAREPGLAIGTRFGVHELLEPAWREFEYHGLALLAGGVSVAADGAVRLTHAILADLEVFGFDGGAAVSWTGRVNLGYRGRGAGGFGDELFGVGAEVGPALRVRTSAGELLGYTRVLVTPGVSFGGGEVAGRLPFGANAGLLFHGPGPVSFRLEGAALRALPWELGAGYTGRAEVLVRIPRGVALSLNAIASTEWLAPTAGVVLWTP